MKCILSWFTILAVIIAGVSFFWAERTHAPTTEVPQGKISAETANSVSGMIQVDAPGVNAIISNPLTITGKARGGWYFEASFPVELENAGGTVIAKGVAQAQWDWMTDAFVPFTATLTYPAQPAGSTGTLVLKKDNPSGEPVNDMSLTIPIQF